MISLKIYETLKREKRSPRPPKRTAQQELQAAQELIEQERRIMAEVYPQGFARPLEYACNAMR